MDKSVNKRVGGFLVENGIISEQQLQEALELQLTNRSRLVGEILVTLGVLSKEELVMALEMYMLMTNEMPHHVEEWLDQDEIDLLMEKIKKDDK